MLFSIMDVPICISTNSVQVLSISFLFIFWPGQHLLPFVFFCNSQSHRCEVIPQCGINLHFPDDYWFEHIFISLTAICMTFLRNTCEILLVIWKLGHLVFAVLYLVYFGISPLWNTFFQIIFSCIYGFVFSFCWLFAVQNF